MLVLRLQQGDFILFQHGSTNSGTTHIMQAENSHDNGLKWHNSSVVFSVFSQKAIGPGSGHIFYPSMWHLHRAIRSYIVFSKH